MNVKRFFYNKFYREWRWQFLEKNYSLPQIDLQSWIPMVEYIEPPIREHLCLPPYHGNPAFDDVQPLLNLVKTFQPEIVLELGTAYGTTVANICMFSDAKIFTVNALPEQISGSLTTYTLNSDEIGSVFKKHGFEKRVNQIYANTKELDLQISIGDNKVDLAIIDACHDPDYVLGDFLKIIPHVSNNSTILLHDTHPNEGGHFIASYVACMYLRKLGYNVRHIKNTTWGIWMSSTGRTVSSISIRLLEWGDRLLLRCSGRTIYEDVYSIYWLAKEHLST